MKDFLKTIVTPTIRHGSTALAGWLVANGVIDGAQGAGFAEAATGLVIGAIAYGWSVWSNKKDAAKLGPAKAA